MTLEADMEALFRAVSLARELGFKSDSSPVDLLLEAGVDLFLLLSSALKEGRFERKKNEALAFSKSQVDVLNNPKQFRIKEHRKLFQDERLANAFRELASWIILVKTNDSKKYSSFMERILGSEVKPRPPVEVKSIKVTKASPSLRKDKIDAYHRRLREKRSKRSSKE